MKKYFAFNAERFGKIANLYKRDLQSELNITFYPD